MNVSELKHIGKAEFVREFKRLGICKGDVVYIASSLMAFGFMQRPAETILESLFEVIGDNGTIVSPAFNFSFCKGEAFDRENTSSMVGVLSEVFRKMDGTKRTHSPPFHSVCANGLLSPQISNIQSITSFGKSSVFQFLHDSNAKILLIGCGFHEGVVHFHWLEELHEVPYRYWKKFEGPLILDGNKFDRSYFMYVRKNGVLLDADPISGLFESTKYVKQGSVGLGRIRVFNLVDFKKYFDPLFERNKNVLLKSDVPLLSERMSCPILRVDHIAIVSKFSNKIKKLLNDVFFLLSSEGIVPQIAVNCQYHSGYNVDIEIVEPINTNSRVSNFYSKNNDSPLHHIAFEVSNLEEAISYFKDKGYCAIDGEIYLAPKPFHRVTFLSPVFTGGMLIELVCNDALNKSQGYCAL